MAYNILFTSLYTVNKDEPLRYYYAEEDSRRSYTDAMLTAEATTRYILSRHHINEIFILGRQITFDAGDDERVLGIDDGKGFYTANTENLSTYSLFRYRLSQYMDDLKIELLDIRELLSPEEQKETIAFLKNFYIRKTEGEEHRKFNRFFDKLVQDASWYNDLKKELAEAIPASEKNRDIYLSWIRNHLYMALRDTKKMEILEENEDAKIRFIPTEVDASGNVLIDTLLKVSRQIEAENHDSINIYIAMNNDDMTDNFLMLGLLDMLYTMNSGKVSLKRICTCSDRHYKVAGRIRDDTEAFGMASLITAANTFLKYGKVDMIVDYWEHSLSKNSQVEKMIYAMRRIDTGISLCCIGDIEKGIRDLRELFRNGFDLSNSDYHSKLFILMSEGIKKDYGRLVTADDAGFIDLVKWAYLKGFYQQCLTLIEAKAPIDMVERGIYFYCGDENEKDRVTEVFARRRNAMKSFEYWKMDDMDHYFVKTYVYFEHPSNTIEYQRDNARTLVAALDNTDPNIVTALSACDDRQALENLLFAYLHVGRVRNETNHASDEHGENGSLFPEEKDISTKLIEIQESIQYFIQAYDTVCENIRGKDPVVVKITADEVKSTARILAKPQRIKA